MLKQEETSYLVMFRKYGIMLSSLHLSISCRHILSVASSAVSSGTPYISVRSQILYVDIGLSTSFNTDRVRYNLATA